MKKYIILTSGISDMGGAEMFTSNKVEYLQKYGWKVDVFFYRKVNNILLPTLQQFSGNRISDLIYNFRSLTSHHRNKIINNISKECNKYDEIVVESQLLTLSYWGEMIAENVNGNHIVNAMEESMPKLSNSEIKFLDFKLKNNQILNAVNERVLKRYFGDNIKEEYIKYIHDFLGKPICSNVIQDIHVDLSKFGSADFNIISLGRLDKPYVLPTMFQLSKFIKKYPNLKFNLIIIGGSPNGEIEVKIQDIFKEVLNVNIQALGYLYPVPLQLIKMANVGIAMANSIDVLTQCGVPTINIDISDLKPIGIYGVTTYNKFNRDVNDERLTLIELLENLLINKTVNGQIQYDSIDLNQDLDSIFEKQINFLNRCLNCHEYFNIVDMYPKRCYLKSQISRFVHKYLIRK